MAAVSIAELGSSICSPGVRNWSRPGQSSERIAAPQAEASNRRTEGETPAATISLRVRFKVKRDDE
jgi:hypothetical protein